MGEKSLNDPQRQSSDRRIRQLLEEERILLEALSPDYDCNVMQSREEWHRAVLKRAQRLHEIPADVIDVPVGRFANECREVGLDPSRVTELVDRLRKIGDLVAEGQQSA